MAWAPIINNILDAPLGTFVEGGYLGGFVSLAQDGVPSYALIVSPAEAGMPSYSESVRTTAESSLIDGKFNTELIINTLGANAPESVKFCYNLVYNGYDDWYMPSSYELEILYFNLAPTDPEPYRPYWYDLKVNPPFSDPALGDLKFNGKYKILSPNPYAVPYRPTFEYTYTEPGQTSVQIFREGGPQAFLFEPVPGTEKAYFSNSAYIGNPAPGNGDSYMVCFADGSSVASSDDIGPHYTRAVRRVAVSDLLWNPVNDAQTPSWNSITPSQNPNWTPIST